MIYDTFISYIIDKTDFLFFDGTDQWRFNADRELLEVDTLSLIILAENVDDGSTLSLKADEKLESAKVFVTDEEESSFYALSLSELFQREKLMDSYSRLREGKIKNYEALLEQYNSCPGCLYWIASGMMTSEYDGKSYNKHKNEIAARILEEIAVTDDPRACKELADYYTWEVEDPEKALNWKIKALKHGDMLDKKQLADFIIDERPDHIDLAINLLNQLRNSNYKASWSNWKEANIYLKGTGKPVDLDKGIKLLKLAAEQEWPMAMADLSYFAYHGIGMTANEELAMSLLERANSLSDNRYVDILSKFKSK